ncbi:MAG: hypothetical protein HYU80_02370 [Candidatus Blackburnbacteria bacterium]|nr:hypothetical protein [Candidatus Blackburnbacteria bacterium]
MELETVVKDHTVFSRAETKYITTVGGISHVVRDGEVVVYARRDPEWRPTYATFRACHEHLVGLIEAGQEPTLSGSGLLPKA